MEIVTSEAINQKLSMIAIKRRLTRVAFFVAAIINTPHYIGVFAGREDWYLAIVHGILVDITHAVSALVAFFPVDGRIDVKGNRLIVFIKQYGWRVVSGLCLAGLTTWSCYLQHLYWKDWRFALSVPTIVVILAILDTNIRSIERRVEIESEKDGTKDEPLQVIPAAKNDNNNRTHSEPIIEANLDAAKSKMYSVRTPVYVPGGKL